LEENLLSDIKVDNEALLCIRADADPIIGTGHIMRCLALAQAWQEQGGRAAFISYCDSQALRERISKEGFQFISVNNPYPQTDDLRQTLEVIGQRSIAWLVLDGYHFTSEYQEAICESGVHLLVIDDMNHQTIYHADILLNQNIHASELKYRCDIGTTLLMGPRYVFLRKEFLTYRNFRRVIPDSAKRILVSLGGADADNVTLKVIKAFCLLDQSQIEITIVVGPANVHEEYLRSALESTGLSYNLLINPQNMVDLMINTDLAISAGGGTYWELAYMGVPCIMIILADNQREVAEELAQADIVCNLGWHYMLSCEDIANALIQLIRSREVRKYMSDKGQELIDGSGTDKTIQAMRSHSERDLK
jgi:UDP-2,4-diacetamido-2,4,6-trideoxy-beta-L-altropyranose hydrolase